MSSLKERVIGFLKEGLTMTPEQRAFMLSCPGGLTCTGPLLAKIGKTEEGNKVMDTRVEDLDSNAWARIELEREKALAEIRGEKIPREGKDEIVGFTEPGKCSCGRVKG